MKYRFEYFNWTFKSWYKFFLKKIVTKNYTKFWIFRSPTDTNKLNKQKLFYSQKLLETDWIFRILNFFWQKYAYSRRLCQEGRIRILTLKYHKSFLEFFWNLFCQLEGCVLMAIYVTHHNFAEVYIFEFLPLCVMVTH